MLHKITYHQQTYQKNEDGAYMILVKLRRYGDIYSDWDPSPFKRRDIEEDFIEYIWDSALDIPFKEDMVVVFLIKEEMRDEKKENQLSKAIINHFTYLLHKTERAYFREKKKSITYLVTGIIFAILAYSGLFSGVDIWTKVFEEGIIIGTWVFFWEAFYDYFIECQGVRQEIKFIKKFLRTKIIFEDN